MLKSENSFLPGKQGDRIFFAILFFYQLFFIFQGVDFTDEGFNATFYQQIFKSPESVQYNFMYWLSGIIGGSYLSAFPLFGLLGLRLAGVIVTMLTIIIAYNLLKKHIKPSIVKIGLLLATLIISNDPKSFFYDNLSELFFVIMICLLFAGLSKNNAGNIFLCGVILAMNSFAKVSNIADCALGAAIIYYAVINKTPITQVLKQVFLLVTGFGVAATVLLVIMKLIGHFSIFLNCIALVREMGKSKENTHGLAKLIKLFRYEYTHAFIYAILFLLITLFTTSVINRLKWKYAKGPIFRIFSFSLLIALFILLFQGIFINWYLLLTTVSGLSLLAALFLVINPGQKKEIRLLAFLGASMVVLLPLGSDFGLYAVGRYALWIAIPIAIDYYLNINSLYSGQLFGSIPETYRPRMLSFFSITEKQVHGIVKWSMSASLLFFLFIAITNTWSDSSDRTKMIYPINNKFMTGIYTTEKKASAINELLTETTKFVKKGDYLLAYDEIPLIYSMTETKPFMRNSWSRLYDREVFKSELAKELEQNKILPVVIYQKVESLDNNWPSPDKDNTKEDMDQPKNQSLREFLEQNHYKLDWENIAFKIYLPPR